MPIQTAAFKGGDIQKNLEGERTLCGGHSNLWGGDLITP